MRRLGLLAAVMTGLLLAAPAFAQKSIKVGGLGTMSDGIYFIGIEKGYFTAQGLQVEVVDFPNAARMMAPLSTGEIQIAGGGVNMGFFNGVARGLPLVAVTTRSYLVPGNDGNIFMVRSDLKDQIKTVADLKGRKVAITPGATTLLYFLGKALETVGMTTKDVETVGIPFPDMRMALARKAVDVAIVVEPFVTQYAEQGLAVRWKGMVEFDPYMQVAVLFYNRDWATKDPEVAKAFMVGWLRAVRDYYEALTGGPNRAEIVRVLAKHTRVKDPALYDKMEWLFIDPNGTLITKNLLAQQEWYHKNGHVPQKVTLDQMVDLSYVEHALKLLGTVPCPKCYKETK